MTTRCLRIAGSAIGFLVAGCAPRAGHVPRDPSVPAPGTYEIRFCPGACGDTTRDPPVRGALVLLEAPFSATALSDSARQYFERYTAILYIADAQRAPTACFALERRARELPTYAGLEAAGLTRWRSRPDSGDFVVTLVHSPDASYVAHLTAAGEALSGVGRSRGGEAPPGSIPDDLIRARRIGPPDLTVCSRAGERAAARLQALRRPAR
jgi:hypothetical protein